jgi:hypothetical protein
MIAKLKRREFITLLGGKCGPMTVSAVPVVNPSTPSNNHRLTLVAAWLISRANMRRVARSPSSRL